VTPLDQIRDQVATLSFDCYGTLIDWESGIRRAFEMLAAAGPHPANVDDLFDEYLLTEAALEAMEYRSYRDVLGGVQERLAQRFGLSVAAERRNLLADSLADWRPFEDTNDALSCLNRRYRVGVLSNVDRDLFAATANHLSVVFDFVVTADDVRAYKPAHPHFFRLLEDAGQNRASILHVAQSLYHDGVPAHQLGIPFVWINRRRETNETIATPLATFPDLSSFADAVAPR
jgi:2-haloacid dehalogenase